MYLSHPVGRIREDPTEGETPGDAGEDVGGE